MKLSRQQASGLMQRFGIRFFPPVRKAVSPAGLDSLIEPNTQHLPERILPLGAYSYSQSATDGIETVGRYCSIGRFLTVITRTHPTDWVSSSPVFYNPQRHRFWTGAALPAGAAAFSEVLPGVRIGDDVWIGDDVTIMGGCTIGTGAVLGSGAVVVGDVAPYSIMGGVPARPIRDRFPPEIAQALLESRWWDYEAADLAALGMADPAGFLKAFDAARGGLTPLSPARKPFSWFLEHAVDTDV